MENETKRINRLNTTTIDQIAAGEVIEGPYSCIKELIDNAIDAKASNIIVEIAIGGREWLKVTDDGIGMSSDDLLISVERHTTSKIHTISDLDTLSTLGFRGEALSSIASVSELIITTCPRQNDTANSIGIGAQIHIKGSEKISFHRDIQANFGTKVEVHNLFYNLPARRKFMKSPTKDFKEIYKNIQQISLAYPHISFQFFSDRDLKLNLPAYTQGTLSSCFYKRICDVLGSDTSSQGLFFTSQLESRAALSGFLGLPSVAKLSRSNQYLIVNGRPVQSIPLSYAIKSGYATALEKEEHPAYVLSLEIDPEEIDVNVHPQKKEIRFRDEEALRKKIESVIAQELFSGIQKETILSDSYIPIDTQDYKEAHKDIPLEPVKKESPSLSIKTNSRSFFSVEPQDIDNTRHKKFEFEPKQDLFKIPSFETQYQATTSTEERIEDTEYSVTIIPSILRTALIVPKSSRERPRLLHIENLTKAMYILQALEHIKKKSTPASESLLVPHLLRLTKEQAYLIEERMKEIISLGFSLHAFGQNTFIIEAVPQGTISGKINIDHFFTKWLQDQEQKEEEEEAVEFIRASDISFGGYIYTKEELQKARIQASLLTTSLAFMNLSAPIPHEFVQYLITEWNIRGRPHASLSGERLVIELDDTVLSFLFSREKK